MTWAAAPATASDVGYACLGSEVAATAQFTQQELAMGFGAYFRLAGVNPGQVIKEKAPPLDDRLRNGLARVLDRARLPNHGHLELTRVLKFLLDLARDLV